MSTTIDYIKLIRHAFGKETATIKLPKDVVGTRIYPADASSFMDSTRFLVACFCRHPRRVLEEIMQSGDKGVVQIVEQLFEETMGISSSEKSPPTPVKVWRGTIGEVLATAYVIGFTKYAVPVFKLRLAPNRRLAMHGEDLLGFQFTPSGEPTSLLVSEAKNWKSVATSVAEANNTLLKVKDSCPTLLNFVIEALDMQDRHNEAKIVQRFLNRYDYNYRNEYLAFVVSDDACWKDDYYLKVNPKPAIPLEIVVVTIPNCEDFQNSVVYAEHDEEITSRINAGIDTSSDLQKLLENTTFKNHHSRLASAALAANLDIEGREKIQYDLNARQIEMAAHFISGAATRLSFETGTPRKELLFYAARILERLATWELERGDKSIAVRAIVNAAVYYSIAGYDANAKVLMETVKTIKVDTLSLLSPIEKCSALFLSGKLSDLEDEIAMIMFDPPDFDMDKSKTEQEWLDMIGKAMAYAADTLAYKSFALLLHYFREGNRELIDLASDNLNRAVSTYSLIGEYESAHLSRILTLYFSNIVENAPFSLLGKYIQSSEK